MSPHRYIQSRLAALIVMAALTLAITVPAHATPPELSGRFDAPTPAGQATGRFLGIPLFDAELWTANGRGFSWSEPFALSLTYRRGFNAGLLVWASMYEMKRIRGIDGAAASALEADLNACFRSVGQNDRITALSETPDSATFYLNGQPTCSVQQPGFRRAFFSIWLDPSARDPGGAARLRGEG